MSKITKKTHDTNTMTRFKVKTEDNVWLYR